MNLRSSAVAGAAAAEGRVWLGVAAKSANSATLILVSPTWKLPNTDHRYMHASSRSFRRFGRSLLSTTLVLAAGAGAVHSATPEINVDVDGHHLVVTADQLPFTYDYVVGAMKQTTAYAHIDRDFGEQSRLLCVEVKGLRISAVAQAARKAALQRANTPMARASTKRPSASL